jgi:Lar family restriction alleviation protein
MIDQLNPCPFCGGSAGFKTASSLFGNELAHSGYFIECDGCGCRSKTVDYWGNQGGDSLNTLTTHWNRRALPAFMRSEHLAGQVAHAPEISPLISLDH